MRNAQKQKHARRQGDTRVSLSHTACALLGLLHPERDGQTVNGRTVSDLPVIVVLELPVVSVVPLHLARLRVVVRDAEVNAASEAGVGVGVAADEVNVTTDDEGSIGALPEGDEAITERVLLIEPGSLVVNTLVRPGGLDRIPTDAEAAFPVVELVLVGLVRQRRVGPLQQGLVDDGAGAVGALVDRHPLLHHRLFDHLDDGRLDRRLVGLTLKDVLDVAAVTAAGGQQGQSEEQVSHGGSLSTEKKGSVDEQTYYKIGLLSMVKAQNLQFFTHINPFISPLLDAKIDDH